jgi:predicted Fe-Mo cluster-binding NifX family protein
MLLVNIKDGTIIRRQETRWVHLNPLERIHLLLQERVKVVICGGLTETCGSLLREAGIEVIPWVRGEIEEVLLQYIHGTLSANTSGTNNRISS